MQQSFIKLLLTAGVASFALSGCLGQGDNAPPAIQGTPLTSAAVGAAYTFQPTAADPDGDPITFDIVNRPQWAAFDSATGKLSGSPSMRDVGSSPAIIISATDGKSKSELPPFSINVVPGGSAPTISGTPGTTANVNQAYSFQPAAADADGQALSFSIANKPSWAGFNAQTGALTGTPSSAHVGTYSNITVSVSDGTLGASLPAFNIVVAALATNTAPQITGTPSIAVVATQNYRFQPLASDAQNDPMTFSINTKPAWATFSPTTGQLTGTPGATEVGVTNGIVISVSDGALSASLPAFSITVTPPPNRAPTIGGTPPTAASVGLAYGFQPTAADPDGNALTFSIANKPAWATFNSGTGALTGMPAAGDVGATSGIVISVSDGIASASLPAFSITVAAQIPTNRAPVISGTPATTVQATLAYQFAPTASDLDGNPLTFSIANKPAWASFSAATGALTGTPSSANVGTTTGIVITVSDGSLSTSLPGFSIQVTAAPNRAPTISGAPATSVVAGSAYAFVPTATDADGDTLTFAITNMPAWATFVTSTGRLAGTPSSANVGTFANIGISVSDGKTSVSLPAFAISVTAPPNSAPLISGSPPTTVQAGNAYNFQPTASDANGDTLTFAVVNKPAWMSFNAQTGALNGTPAAGDVGTYPNITIRVSDGVASVSLPAFTVTVTAAPTTGSAALSWTAPTLNDDGTPLTNLGGYRIYKGTSPSALSQIADIASAGTTSYVVSNLASGTHYFALSSYTTAGVESARTTPVSKTIP